MMKKQRIRFSLGLAIIATLFLPKIQAHEFWVEPSSFNPAPKSLVILKLRVGDGFPGEAFPRSSSHLKQFVLIKPDGEKQKIPGRVGRDPAGYIRLQDSGIYTITYVSHANQIKLDAKKFNKYLKSEGLHHVLKERIKRQESQKVGTESYSRIAKSLIRVGTQNRISKSSIKLPLKPKNAISYPCEIVLLNNPWKLDPKENLKAQVLYDGKPAKGVQILATLKPIKDGPSKKEKPNTKNSKRSVIITDSKGIAYIPMSKKGIWLLNTIRMERAEKKSFDWRSYWGSLTFDSR